MTEGPVTVRMTGITKVYPRGVANKLRGTKVTFLVRIFSIEVCTKGYTDPVTNEVHPREIYRVLCVSHSLSPGLSYLDIPPDQRIFLACLESETVPLEDLKRGQPLIVEGTVWGANPDGAWRVVYLKDYTTQQR